jgi:ATP-dependent DNA helicase RecQ
VGSVKLAQFGEDLFAIISEHCKGRGLPVDQKAGAEAPAVRTRIAAPASNSQKETAIASFRRGDTIDAVMASTDRARSTVLEYLCEFIRNEKPESVLPWVTEAIYGTVASAAEEVGSDRLRPIRERVGDAISYDEIRVVLTHLSARS